MYCGQPPLGASLLTGTGPGRDRYRYVYCAPVHGVGTARVVQLSARARRAPCTSLTSTRGFSVHSRCMHMCSAVRVISGVCVHGDHECIRMPAVPRAACAALCVCAPLPPRAAGVRCTCVPGPWLTCRGGPSLCGHSSALWALPRFLSRRNVTHMCQRGIELRSSRWQRPILTIVLLTRV